MQRLNTGKLKVSYESTISNLPDWAVTALEIGALAGYAANLAESRLVLFCVVPCRQIFTALLGFGTLACRAAISENRYSWLDFLSIDDGTEVFWTQPGIKESFAGKLMPQEIIGGNIMRSAAITRPKKKSTEGLKWIFSESKYKQCVFSADRLPLKNASENFEKADKFFKELDVKIGAGWFMKKGAELRIISNISSFQNSLKGWTLTAENLNYSISLENLLLLKKEGDTVFAKTLITSSLGRILSKCPVSILDGPLTFQRIQDIDSGSLIIVLERHELMQEHIDFLIQAKSQHIQKSNDALQHLIPKKIASTVEVSGYCLI